MRIKHRVILTFVTVALLIGLLGWSNYYHQVGEAEHLAIHEAESIAKTIAFEVATHSSPGGLSWLDTPAELQEHVMELKRLQERDIVILDTEQRIIADAVPEEVGEIMEHDTGDEVGKTIMDGRQRAFTEVSPAYPQGILSIVVPMDAVDGTRLGAVVLEYTPLFNDIKNHARNHAIRYSLYFGGTLFAAIILGYAIARHISRPLDEMRRTALEIAGGNLDARVGHHSSDEIGDLAESFNRMAGDIKEHMRQADDERAKTEAVIEGLSDGLILQDLDYRVTYENAVQKIEMGDHVGEYCYKAYADRDSICEDCPMVFSLRDRGVHKVERMVEAKTGIKHFELITSPLLDSLGAVVGGVKINRDVTESKEAEEKIKASLREKEVLLQEIHHRVKNNLAIITSLLRLQSRYVEDQGFAEMLKESQNRIKTMALIHERLYQGGDLGRIDFGKYVGHLVGDLFSSYDIKVGQVKRELEIEDVPMDLNVMIPCGLIINELVTNSLKHAFKGVASPLIRISLARKDGKAVLKASDNGTGIPEEIDITRHKSLGLQIVNSLTRQLRGTLVLERNGGTAFVITFDLAGENGEKNA